MITVQKIEHVGIRVTNLKRALVFYEKLGFSTDPKEVFPEYRTVGIVNQTGIRINLIAGAEKFLDNQNILIDNRRKYPGVTHVAFVVKKIADVLRYMEENGITITEGPMQIGDRRTIFFVRDPDGNIIEFNQLLKP